MVPHAKVRKGENVYLLIRYGDRFRFVIANERLTEATERHILSAPCEDSELDMLRLTYEPLPVKDVWSYAMSDTAAGSGLLLYVGSEVRSYHIHEDVSADQAAALLEGIGKFGEVEPPKPEIPQMEDWRLERQDPRVLRWIKPLTRCWNGIAIFFSLGALFLGGNTSLLVCTLIVPLTLLLYLLLPQYYSFLLMEEEYHKYGYTAPVELSFVPCALIFPSFVLGLRQVSSDHYNLPLHYYLIALALLLSPLLLRYLSREVRDHREIIFFLCVIVTLFYSFSAPLFVDRFLTGAEPPPQPYEVIEKDFSIGKGGAKHCVCEVELDGELVSVWISESYYDILQPGDTVMVVHDKGALGFDYAYVVEKAE